MINVLFLCTANSARSILAEAILNTRGADRFRAHSAGSTPSGRVNPNAIALLERRGLPTQGLRSKGWDDFATPQAPRMDLVFTVCDNAAGETCPLWPGQPVTAHWGIEDPAAATGDAHEVMRAFERAHDRLAARIDLLLALPADELLRPDRAALGARLRAIDAKVRFANETTDVTPPTRTSGST
jgi:protein-tyrosine-phosphatase